MEIFSVTSETVKGARELKKIEQSIEKSAGKLGLVMVQSGTYAVAQGGLGLMQGGDLVSSAVSGFAGSLGASAFGAIAGEFANSTIGTYGGFWGFEWWYRSRAKRWKLLARSCYRGNSRRTESRDAYGGQ